MASYRSSPPPDWSGWGGDALYSSRHDPLSGGYPPDGDYAELMAPLPGPASPRLPALPGTVFDDVRDFSKIGLDLVGELRDAFSRRSSRRDR
jgi:hypothetical protein